MEPERDDEDQSEERLGQHGRTQQKKRRLQEEQRDRQFRAVKLDPPRQTECLPCRRKADDDREKFRRRVAELRRERVEQCEERPRPDADQIARMTVRPAREQIVIAGVLLVGVVIEQNQRGADGGENNQPDQCASQALIIPEISNHRAQKTKGKNQTRNTRKMSEHAEISESNSALFPCVPTSSAFPRFYRSFLSLRLSGRAGALRVRVQA